MPADLAIDSLPKGALPDPPDPRDYAAAFVMGAVSVDWSKEFRHLAPPNEDQGSSLSCVSQAWSYYHWQLTVNDYSRRDLYSRIYLPEGGAYLRAGGDELVARGQNTRSEAPDPFPQTEANMRDRTGISEPNGYDDREAGYFSLDGHNIDAVAAAIQAFKGVVFGVQGSNPGWADLANPRPPKASETTWGHALYGFGFHLHDGKKCIIAKSSWCGTGISEHHIKQDYFESWNTFSAWTLIPKERLPMYNRYLVHHLPTGRLGVLVVGQTGFGDPIVWAKNQDMLTELKQQFEVPADAQTITLA